MAPKLFSPYTQAKLSTVRQFGGTGLGLAICRQIVDYMKGMINLTSEVGVGSTFTVLLPFVIDKDPLLELTHVDKVATDKEPLIENSDREPELPLLTPDSKKSSFALETTTLLVSPSSLTPTATPSISTSTTLSEQHTQHTMIELTPIAPKRILVVDDNEINRKIMTKILTTLGYQISVAVDGLDAVKIVTSQSKTYFLCIFMDISMPNMDGYEATRNIRKNDITVPIIALTANSLSEEKTKAESAGMNHFCTKPLRKDKVVELLDNLLTSTSSTNLTQYPNTITQF